MTINKTQDWCYRALTEMGKGRPKKENTTTIQLSEFMASDVNDGIQGKSTPRALIRDGFEMLTSKSTHVLQPGKSVTTRVDKARRSN